MTFSKRPEIDLCRFIIVVLLNFYSHLSRAQISSFRLLFCVSLYTTSSIRCHTFLLMFRFGLRAGQAETAILFDFRYASTFFAMWILASSCCQIHLFWQNCLWRHRIKVVYRSSRNFRLLYLPLITFITKSPKQSWHLKSRHSHHPFDASLDAVLWRYHFCDRCMNWCCRVHRCKSVSYL